MREKPTKIDAEYTAIEENSTGRSSTFDHFRLLGLCSLLSFSVNFVYAFSSTYTNSAVDSFKAYINESMIRMGRPLSQGEYSLLWNIIVNVWFVGFFIGIWLSRWLTDKYGRKPAFMLGNSFNVLGCICLSASIILYQPILLFIGRIICSTATSVSYCALVLYLQEVPPHAKRGSTSFLNGNIYSFIAILGITLGNDELLGKHLAFYLGFAIIPCIASLLIVYLLPETPKFLVSRERIEEAENSIAFYHGRSANVEETLKSIHADVSEAKLGESVRISDFFTERHLRNALFLALAAIQNTVALWTILLSSTYYLEQTGLEHSISQWSSTVMAIAYFAGTTTGVFTIDKFGRRTLLIWSNIANMSSLLFYTAFAQLEPWISGSKYGCLPMLAIFGYTYGAGVGPVSRFIGPELVPLKYRSLITAVVFSENTVINIITSFSCRPLFNVAGPYAFIILYVIPSVFCTFYIWKYLPETKGAEIKQIVETLKSQ